jgi:hypothetical protein
MVQPDIPEVTIIRHKRVACWITRSADTHPEYVILTAFPPQNGYAKAPECHVYT